MSKNQKIAMGSGILMVISLFLPFEILPPLWPDTSSIFSGLSFIEVSFSGYIFLALGAAGLFFNYKEDTTKARYSYLGAIAWFVIWLFTNSVDDSSGIGFYLLIISIVVSFIYTNKLNSGDTGE